MNTLHLKLFIVIFCISLFCFGAGELSLGFKGDENFYFESAKGMSETGDLLTPRYRGETRFQKPIFFYWLVFLSFKLLGISWFAARLPSILFGAFTSLLIFAVSDTFFGDKKTGLFAALFAATTPLYYRYARLAVPDMTLVFFMTLALYCFARYHKNPQDRKYAKLFFFALALAFLIKGPVGLFIPLAVSAVFCLIKRDRNIFGLGNLVSGIAIFILIVTPWFYFIYKIHGDTYTGYVFSREILQRLGAGCSVSFIGTYLKGFFFYLGVLITKFIPYSLFIPVAFLSSLNHVWGRSGDREMGDAHLFMILWFMITFLFFMLVAERRTHYFLALSPPVSIFVGACFARALSDSGFFSRFGFKLPYVATVGIIAVFAIVFIISGYVAGEGEISLWKVALAMIPLILILGTANKNFVPWSIVLSLSLIYIAVAEERPLGLFLNKMERAASVIERRLDREDRIGIGSHGIIPEELQVFFEIPVENVKAMYNSDDTPNMQSASQLINFLNSDKRIFAVIKRKDYENFIPAQLRQRLYVLDRYYVWKRRIKFDEGLKESLAEIKPGPLREIFQNEIYIITNKP